tara:strand:- start:10599 stop:11384 length:786 start_codon:yes stop_codon:yes gene_type:complete
VQGKNANFRSVLKSNNEQQIQQQFNKLCLSILFLANTYTGAKFQNPPSEDDKNTLRSCAKFIIDMFPQLGQCELELIFQLAAAGKFNINLETYYGKFSVNFLGKLLTNYLTFRNKIILTYEKEKEKDQAKEQQQQAEEKNQRTKEQIIEKYRVLKQSFEELGVLPEFDDVQSFWAKILIDANIIHFTENEKKCIWEEAKAKTERIIKNEYCKASLTDRNKKNLRNLIKKISEGKQDNDFNSKAVIVYSKMLIIKSIYNEDD